MKPILGDIVVNMLERYQPLALTLPTNSIRSPLSLSEEDLEQQKYKYVPVNMSDGVMCQTNCAEIIHLFLTSC